MKHCAAQITIPELGLYHYKARVYSPTLGRFLQTDPIGYEDQVNLYAYVGNDPVNSVDPTGESITITCTVAEGEVKSCTGSQQDDGVDKVFLTIRTVNSDGSISRSTRVIGQESSLRSDRDLANNVQSAFKQLYNLDVAISVGTAANGGSTRQPFQNERQAREAAEKNGWDETNLFSPGKRGKFYKDKLDLKT